MKIKYDTIVKAFLVSAVLGVAISYSSLYLFHILLVVVLLSQLYLISKNNKFLIHRTPTKLHYIFYIMFIWYTLSMFWCLHIRNALIYLFILFCGISTVIIIISYAKNQNRIDSVFKVLAAVFIIEIVLSFFECLGIIRLPISPFSELSSLFGRKMIADNPELFKFTPSGFNWNPNNLAVVMNIVLPFALFYKNTNVKLFLIILILIIIFQTDSRGNILTSIFIIGLYLFVKLFRISARPLKISRRTLYLIYAFIIILVSFYFYNYKIINIKIEDSYFALKGYLFEKFKSEDSIGERQRFIKNGLNALEKKSYFLGVGAGNSGNLEYHKNVADFYKTPGRVSLHFFWIEIIVDSGVVFGFLFIFWYIYLIYRVFYIAYKSIGTLKYYASSICLSLLGFIFGAVSASSVIYELSMWLMFGFAIALINQSTKSSYITDSISVD
ncbi:MAG: O-antigen ligase family protein [Bacteroidales bacterium]